MIAGRGMAALVVLAVVALLAVSVASLCSGASRLSGGSADRADVTRAARLFVEAVGTVDGDGSPAAYLDRLVALSADPLRAELAGSLVDPAAASRSVRTHITAVDLLEVDGDRARVSVAARQARRAIDPATGQATDSQVNHDISLVLVREDGRWLVSEFRLLGSRAAAG